MSRPRQFESLRASELHCPKCRTMQPVRERLLLVLPHAEIYDYRCVVCGTSLGGREVKGPAQPIMPASAIPPVRSPALGRGIQA